MNVAVPMSGGAVEVACLSMGNPHAVRFVDDVTAAPVASIGPEVERNALFPNGANVEFVHVTSPGRLEVRVWERGSGETRACGTGACAAAVAARLLHGCGENIDVVLPGGVLQVTWRGSLEDGRSVTMEGPARRVFAGDVDLDATLPAETIGS